MRKFFSGILLLAAVVTVFDALWLHTRPARAQGSLKVYVQQVRDKHWNDLLGTEIVGFACGPTEAGNNSQCYIASR